MGAHSLTWKSLPTWLLEPVMAEVILLSQAAEIHDLILLSAPDEISVEMPLHLHLQDALERLMLWEVEAPPTKH